MMSMDDAADSATHGAAPAVNGRGDEPGEMDGWMNRWMDGWMDSQARDRRYG